MRFIQRRGPFQTKRHGDSRREAAWLNAKWVKGCVTTQPLPLGIISLQPPGTEDALTLALPVSRGRECRTHGSWVSVPHSLPQPSGPLHRPRVMPAGTGNESEGPWFRFHLCHLLALWSWVYA